VFILLTKTLSKTIFYAKILIDLGFVMSLLDKMELGNDKIRMYECFFHSKLQRVTGGHASSVLWTCCILSFGFGPLSFKVNLDFRNKLGLYNILFLFISRLLVIYFLLGR